MQLLKELLQIKKDAVAEINKALKVSLREVFTSYPAIKGIWWAQYTPYHNDGEPCVFGINDIYFTNQEVSENPDDEGNKPTWGDAKWDSEFWFNSWTNVGEKASTPEYEEFSRQMDEVEGLLNSLEDELYDCFGDHVEITLLPDRILVEEYDHE